MRPGREQALFNDAVHSHRLKSILPPWSTSITEEHTGKHFVTLTDPYSTIVNKAYATLKS